MPTLHHAPGTRGIRVLWTLEEIGAPYDVASEPFPPRTRNPDFLKINATGTIPAFVEDGRVMTESMAICQHLAETHARADLQVAPGEDGRADYLQWLWFGEATLSIPTSLMARVRRLSSPQGTELLIEDLKLALSLRLGALEARLQGRDFIVANRFTLADVSCFYTLLLVERFALTELLGPNTIAYDARLRLRPALIKALAVP